MPFTRDSFPCYARSKITWTIDNFLPEILKNQRFYSFKSPEFSIPFTHQQHSWFHNCTKWRLSIERTQTSLSLHIESVKTKGYDAYEKYDKLKLSFDVYLLGSDGEIFNRTQEKSLRSYWYCMRMARLINYRELVTKKRKLLENNKLTIVAILDIIEDPKVEMLKAAISTDYEKLFNNKKFSDFTLVTSDGEEIPVHKNILSIRSPVFDTMMETKMLENKEGRATITDIDGKALLEFLRFVYCGRVEKIEEVAIDLMHAATKYDLSDLKPLCVASMTANISVENVLEALMSAHLYEENLLKKYCIDYIKWHYEEVKEMTGWEELPQPLFRDVLDVVLSGSSDCVIKISSKVTYTPATAPAPAPDTLNININV